MVLANTKINLLLLQFPPTEAQKISRTLEKSHFCIQASSVPPQDFSTCLPTPQAILVHLDFWPSHCPAFVKGISQNDIPLLFITSGLQLEKSTWFLGKQMDFMLSPFSDQELILRIKQLLTRAGLQAEIRFRQEHMQKIIESRDKLYSVIAHDLRAPIGTIKMINSSLESQRERITDAHILKLFEMINETTEEAFNLLENLLRWTRNQNGQTKVYPLSFNLSATIRQVVSLFKTIASSKGITLLNHAEKPVYVYADEDMIKTVLRNLISNAVKFTYEGGRIEIDVSVAPNEALVSVKDNGKGIPDSLQPKLLKSDEYISTYGTRRESGSGLGLLLSRDFINLNKGKICFASQEGQGTTFYFTVPLTVPQETSSNS